LTTMSRPVATLQWAILIATATLASCHVGVARELTPQPRFSSWNDPRAQPLTRRDSFRAAAAAAPLQSSRASRPLLDHWWDVPRGGGDGSPAPTVAAAARSASFGSLSLTEQVIHVVTRVSMIHGMVNYIAPGPVCETYGILKPSLLTQLLTRRIGIVLLSMGILVYGVFVKEWDVEVCFGMSQIPWIVEFCGTILNDESKRVGFNSSLSQYLALFVHAFAMYGAHQPYSPIVMLTTGCFDAITGALMYFYPEFSLQSRGAIMKRTDPTSRWMTSYAATKDYGLWLCTYGLMLVLYAWGTMDPLKVFVYTRTFIFFRSFIVNVMEVDKLGFNPIKSNLLFSYHCIVAAALWLSIWND
jgi:hypothetical protein